MSLEPCVKYGLSMPMNGGKSCPGPNAYVEYGYPDWLP